MSTALIDRAKKILAKGRELGDVDLIDMGLEMIEAYTDGNVTSEPPEAPKTVVPAKKKVGRPATVKTEDFVMNNELPSKFGKKVPVQQEKRKNTWVDDMTEATKYLGKTPKGENGKPLKVKKKPKPKMVTMTCGACGKKNKQLATLVFSEYYRCDDCILKGRHRVESTTH